MISCNCRTVDATQVHKLFWQATTGFYMEVRSGEQAGQIDVVLPHPLHGSSSTVDEGIVVHTLTARFVAQILIECSSLVSSSIAG